MESCPDDTNFGRRGHQAHIHTTPESEGLMKTIRQLREEARLSQMQLAVLLRVSVSAVYKWERGINMPKAATLKEIARVFDVRMDDIDLGVQGSEPGATASADSPTPV